MCVIVVSYIPIGKWGTFQMFYCYLLFIIYIYYSYLQLACQTNVFLVCLYSPSE